jgi:hypothetical protein
VYAAKESSRPRPFVNILDYDHAWRLNTRDVLPPIGAFDVAAAHDRWISRSNFACGRAAHHGRKIFEETAKPCGGKPFIAQTDTKTLNRIRYYARVEGPELIDLLGR